MDDFDFFFGEAAGHVFYAAEKRSDATAGNVGADGKSESEERVRTILIVVEESFELIGMLRDAEIADAVDRFPLYLRVLIIEMFREIGSERFDRTSSASLPWLEHAFSDSHRTPRHTGGLDLYLHRALNPVMRRRALRWARSHP